MDNSGYAWYLSIILAGLLSHTALPTNYAFVLGGAASMMQKGGHEFAFNTACATEGLRAKGYETTTLFGSLGIQSTKTEDPEFKEISDILKNKKLTKIPDTFNKDTKREHSGLKVLSTEKEHYPDDLNYIGEQLKVTQGATAKNIDRYFTQLSSKVKPGDKVEIAVFAHGRSTCQSKEGDTNDFNGPSDNLAENCSHTIGLFDEKGNKVQYPTEEFFNHVKLLETQGAKVNVVLHSCFSGRAQSMTRDLKDACVFFSSAGDAPAYACMEDDDANSTDYTSTGDSMCFRYCAELVDTLKNKSFYQNKKCFAKRLEILQQFGAKLDFSSMHSTYWTARRFDQAPQEPSLNTQLSFKYFTEGKLGRSLLHQVEPIRPESLEKTLSELISDFSDKKEVRENLERLKTSISKYNDSISVQKQIKAGAKNGAWSESQQEELAKAQKVTAKIAQELIKSERELLELVRRLGAEVGSENTKQCGRTL